MAKKKTYEQYLREELASLVEQLKLPNLYKQSLKQRWIDQVVWGGSEKSGSVPPDALPIASDDDYWRGRAGSGGD